MMPNDDHECATCGRTYEWHQNNATRHKFDPGDDSVPRIGGPVRRRGDDKERVIEVMPRVSAFPFDPVLRQALIDKGVITADDLTEAEGKINAVTGQLLGGGGGKPTT